jgi:hypothetical protein
MTKSRVPKTVLLIHKTSTLRKKISADCELITKVSQATITTRNYFCGGKGTLEIRSQEEKQTNTLVFHRYAFSAQTGPLNGEITNAHT